jgi:hypothetical protein
LKGRPTQTADVISPTGLAIVVALRRRVSALVGLFQLGIPPGDRLLLAKAIKILSITDVPPIASTRSQSSSRPT